MEALSPIVQAATTGTDWPAIAAAVSTGVVGLAGIVATFLSGKRTINAEDARARLAQKRQMYVGCLTAFAEMSNALSALDLAFPPAEQDAETWEITKTRYDKATDGMNAAVLLLELGAPR